MSDKVEKVITEGIQKINEAVTFGFRKQINELTESNRQLREELERVKAFSKEEHDIVQRVWKALGKETYQECKPYTIWEWVELQRTALAAAKEALATIAKSPWAIADEATNALARIAECERSVKKARNE